MKNSPAFPTTVWEKGSEDEPAVHSIYPGMTLLDYFAGQALEGLITAHPEDFCPPLEDDVTVYARRSYIIAIAMLEERAKHLEDQ